MKLTKVHSQFFKAIYNDIMQKKKHNKTSIEKLARSFGIEDKNLVKEITENAIVTIAREIASDKTKLTEQIYNEIVKLYNSQVNLSHRTSQSMMLQQYSTPATIAYLMGKYCNIDKVQKCFEPSAGNGMLTIASSGKNFDVNEIDDVRNKNLKFQNIYHTVTKKDSSKRSFKTNYYDAVVTNPPFGRLDKDDFLQIDGFTIKELDHKMAILALNAMKDNGKAAIIVGGHTKWDAKGRIQSGKNRTFLSYLYRNYNVDDILQINGKNLYSRMGTGFNTRVILINGRKETPSGYAPLKNASNTDVINTHEELYNSFKIHFKKSPMDLLEKANRYKNILSKGLNSPYIPTSESCITLNVDTPDSMSFEIHNAIKNIKAKVGSLNQYLIKRLKYKSDTELCKALAAEQIDGVATAVFNIETKNQGVIIGDQTGIGKGRQAAAIIRYARENGYLPIFLTEKANLFSDLYRDLEDIGNAHYRAFIVNAKASKTNIKNNAGKIVQTAPSKAEQERIFNKQLKPKSYDYICATYSQFASAKPTIKQAWLSAIADNAIIIMDESHNASGNSATGMFLKNIVKKSKSTIFLSATFAKRPDNMPIYALKTSMQDANMNDEQLVEAIQNGGVALQEILASQLVAEGQMIRRERTYEGIEVNYITLDKKSIEHNKIADNITKIIRDIISFQNNHIDTMVEELDKIAIAEQKQVDVTKGTKNAGVDNSPYFSRVFNVINQMLFSIKADDVANRAIGRLKQGKKVVIAFSNTMGAFIDETSDGDVIDADFKEVLRRGLDSVLSYTTTDMYGNRDKQLFSPAEMDTEAREEYYRILDDIEKASTGIVISPIDLIVQKLNKAGYTTAEVTGRKKEVQLSFKKNGQITGLILNRKKENTNDAFRRFNNNEADVLLINQSGSTGASAHAVPTKKVPESEVKQRVMIVLQAELNINTEIQKRGRINRTGQILKPIYDYVSSSIPAEKRLQMMLKKKLKSLDANTTSNQKNSEDLLKSDDFLNKYGDEIVETWLKENPEMNKILGNIINDKKKEKPANLAHKTSGRVAILPVQEQENFYKTILSQYKQKVDMLIKTGRYDLEVESLNLEAETLNREIAVVGRSSGSLFGGNTYIEHVMINNLRKPMLKKEIDAIIKKNLGKKTPETIQTEMLQRYDKYVETSLSNIHVDKTKKWDKVKANITKEKGYKKANDQQKYFNDRVDQIEAALEDDIFTTQTKFRNRSGVIRRFLKYFKIGRTVKYPTVDYGRGSELVNAIVIGASFNERANNPFTPSNVVFSFAIADGNRRLDFTSSGDNQTVLQSIIGSSYHLNDDKEQDIYKNWDINIKNNVVNRIKAYIVTGNILQAYSKYNKGKLISYTTKNGEIKKGIMLPLGYDPNDRSNAISTHVSVPIALAYDFIRSSSSGASIETNSPIKLQRQYDSVKIYLPASKSRGGKYFLDDEILSYTKNGNFEKVSNYMIDYVVDEELKPFLKLLQDKFKISAMIPKDRVEQIKTVQDAIKKNDNSKNTQTNKVNVNKAKALALKAKALRLRLKLKIA